VALTFQRETPLWLMLRPSDGKNFTRPSPARRTRDGGLWAEWCACPRDRSPPRGAGAGLCGAHHPGKVNVDERTTRCQPAMAITSIPTVLFVRQGKVWTSSSAPCPGEDQGSWTARLARRRLPSHHAAGLAIPTLSPTRDEFRELAGQATSCPCSPSCRRTRTPLGLPETPARPVRVPAGVRGGRRKVGRYSFLR